MVALLLCHKTDEALFGTHVGLFNTAVCIVSEWPEPGFHLDGGDSQRKTELLKENINSLQYGLSG